MSKSWGVEKLNHSHVASKNIKYTAILEKSLSVSCELNMQLPFGLAIVLKQ
jgi:hypothetical protein